jgi:hypothetical protein
MERKCARNGETGTMNLDKTFLNDSGLDYLTLTPLQR